MALGIPCILSNNTAVTTICETVFVRAVPSNIKVSSNEMYQYLFNESCGNQFNCDVKDAAKALTDVYDNYKFYLKEAQRGREWVKQYDCKNPKLRKSFRTLIHPKDVILSEKNEIVDDNIFTNSTELYEKYKLLINSY